MHAGSLNGSFVLLPPPTHMDAGGHDDGDYGVGDGELAKREGEGEGCERVQKKPFHLTGWIEISYEIAVQHGRFQLSFIHTISILLNRIVESCFEMR